jgi:hypothetical protein
MPAGIARSMASFDHYRILVEAGWFVKLTFHDPLIDKDIQWVSERPADAPRFIRQLIKVT